MYCALDKGHNHRSIPGIGKATTTTTTTVKHVQWERTVEKVLRYEKQAQIGTNKNETGLRDTAQTAGPTQTPTRY